MPNRSRNPFTTITTAGLLLPVDLLTRVVEGDLDLPGLTPKDYHLHGGERLNEAASRAWNQCQAAWKTFRKQFADLPASDTGTTVTRDQWLLPLFQELGYGRLQTKPAIKFEEKEYPVSHGWENHVPIHLLSARYPLDRRTPGVAGAAARSPYSMMQELLNRSAQHRWGFVSNGLKLFVLRDNAALARAANVEFDLEAMMDGEIYADFLLLFLLGHQSRVEILPRAVLAGGRGTRGKRGKSTAADEDDEQQAEQPDAEEHSGPENCWLEKWSHQADQQGTRAREKLRDGVEAAIRSLGAGFLTTKGNNALRDRLRSGELAIQDYYRQLLRLVYRLLMLLVAEEKTTESGDNLLHPPGTNAAVRDRYARFYSVGRIRTLAEQRRGTSHTDLYESLKVLFHKMRDGYAPLGIPGFGSFLFSPAATLDLDSAGLANQDLLDAFRHLCYTEDASGRGGAVRRPVDFGNLGSEELGSVYESLLELHPQIDTDAGPFTLGTAAGHERKTTGSYYTPTSLINCLLDSALDPVVEDRLKEADRLAGGEWQTDEQKTQALEIVLGRDLPPPSDEVVTTELPHPVDQKRRARDKSAAPAEPAIAAEAPAEYETAALKRWDKLPRSARYARLAEHALLSMKICDPACGSGHFLIAAAERMATHLARLRTGDDQPGTLDIQHAKRDIIGRCIYGVDLNPMAVELCKVSLWMEALEPGKPLSFLDHHIQCGNSLLGATPKLLADGIPDDAFKPIEGDDKTVCSQLKKENKRERTEYKSGQGYLFDPPFKLGNAAGEFARLTAASDDSVQSLTAKEQRYARLIKSVEYCNARLWADTWCAAFVWKKDKTDLGQHCPTERKFRDIERNPHNILPPVRAEIERLRDQYQFFHWHLAFPDVFRMPAKDEVLENVHTGWKEGFDVVLGNPPWDRLKHNEVEWFSERAPAIANAPTTVERKKLIGQLAKSAPGLAQQFAESRRRFDGTSLLIRASGRYHYGAGGEANLAILFAETATWTVCETGRVGMVLPTTIVTDKSAQALCHYWITHERLASVFDFENREKLFPSVDSRYKFCVLTLVGVHARAAEVEAVFYATNVTQTRDVSRQLRLTPKEIRSLNPNTISFPVIRSKRDGQLLVYMHGRAEPLLLDSATNGGKWGYGVSFLFEMNKSSHLFHQTPAESLLPLLEAKLVHQFDHRAATFAEQSPRDLQNGHARQTRVTEHQDPTYSSLPRYWLPEASVEEAFKRAEIGANHAMVIREITNSTNERTIISCVIPRIGMGHTCWTIRLASVTSTLAACFLANLNSFALDYAARQKVGGMHMSNFILKQVPVFPPEAYDAVCDWSSSATIRHWMVERVVELTYTAWDLKPFAADCGYEGAPFRWDEDRRFLLRSELDAAFFHLYLSVAAEWGEGSRELLDVFPTPRDAVAYIMDTFPIVRRKDEAAHGEYRTKRVILEIYDAMAEAIRTGRPYQTRLDPPPGPPTDPEGNFLPVTQWDPANWPPHIHPPRHAT